MALSVDYSSPGNYVIAIPKADLTLIQSSPTEIRQLNVDTFRFWLMDLQDEEEHQWAPTTHEHTFPKTVAGVTLARVVEILDPYWLEFEDGQYNVNIVGGNSNVSDRTIKNQVGLNTANSAGLQDPVAFQAAAFGNMVCMDQSRPDSGIEFPYGTRGQPVNNVADLISIAETRSIRTACLLSDTTLGAGDFSDGYNFVGDNQNVVLTIQSAPNITNCEFHDITVEGDLDGANVLHGCTIKDLNYFNGYIFQCGFSGTLTLLGSSTAVILQSFSVVAGAGPGQHPWVDFATAHDTPLVIRDWNGGIGFKNASSQTAAFSVDMSSGRVVFENTVTAGTYAVRGIVAEIEDDSGPGANVLDQTLSAETARIRKHQTNRLETDPVTGVATLYEDDGVTPLETSDMFEDVAGAQPYRGRGAERRDGFS
jgi:hypothetical protein